jgi:hypothetical protein
MLQALAEDPQTVTTADPSVPLLADRRQAYVQCAAELAECSCPDVCERDHDND